MNLDPKILFLNLREKMNRTPSGKEGGIELYRDWEFIISGTIIFTLLSVAFGFYVFYHASKSGVSSNGNIKSSSQTLNRKELDTVISRFENKRVEFTTLKSKRPELLNP